MAVILNETAAALFGFTDRIGQKIYTFDGNFNPAEAKPEQFIELTIIGVVKDFHYESLRDNIGALCFQPRQIGRTGVVPVQRYGDRLGDHCAGKRVEKPVAGPAVHYRFLDDAFARMYEAEQRVGKIAGIFGILSVLVSCLGLFGLAAFTTEQRTKEISIRKVLGASVAYGFAGRRFYETRGCCHRDCHTRGLVFYAAMAIRFCLPG